VELTRTPRLLLRRWEEADLPAFFDLYSHDDVMRWLGAHPRRALATADEARERLDRWVAGGRRLDPPLGMWAMVPLSPAGQSPLGTLLLMPLTDADGPAGLVEIGWHLHPLGQGQGLATEAAEAVLTAAAAAGIGDVFALTDLDNVRSQAVAVRLGMTDEGTTDRWYGLTTRQFRKPISVRDR
jgi:RimJ/RimL family protein N-acetyltransferase